MKTKEIGNISFTEEGYDEFKTLSKEEQLEKVYNSLSPKDMDKAEKLLEHIPHGNISSGVQEEAGADNEAGTAAGDGKNNTKRRQSGFKEGEA